MPPQGMNGTPKAAARRPAVRLAQACSSRRTVAGFDRTAVPGREAEIALHGDDPGLGPRQGAGAAQDVDVVARRLLDDFEVAAPLADQLAHEREGTAVQEAAAERQGASVRDPGGEVREGDDLLGSGAHRASSGRETCQAAR